MLSMGRNCLGHAAMEALRVALFFSCLCLSGQKIPETEQILFDSANRERAARHLPALKWDEGLARAAREHAKRMAEQDLLEHQLPGEPDLSTRAREAGASFSHIAENIGVSPSADKFHDGWMHSPGHRANILDADSDCVGIAVVEDGEELYAVEDFARAVTPFSIEEQEKRVGALLADRGLRLIDIGNDARKSCELEHDYAGNRKPRYVMHYESPDLSQLPGNLEREIQSHRHKSAAVGACTPKATAGFTRFRIVVLLY